jgi:hypothetical protein
MGLDLTLVLQITLIGNNHDGEEVLVLHLLRSTSLSSSEGKDRLTLRIC